MIEPSSGPGGPFRRLARGVRDWGLDRLYDRAGMVRVVNGTPIRVLPRYRVNFPSDYDAPVATFLRERVKPGMTCVNVGANLGIYTIQFAAWSAPQGQVIAFEPNPATAALLRRHIEMNGLGDRVRVVEQAVSSKPGRAEFHLQGVDGMSRLGAPNPLLKGTRTIQVEVTTLDHFFARERVSPDWILIDVEGFEAAALAGARRVIESRPEMGVVVEMHPDAWPVAGSDLESFRSLLASLHRRPTPLTGQSDPMLDYGVASLEQLGPIESPR